MKTSKEYFLLKGYFPKWALFHGRRLVSVQRLPGSWPLNDLKIINSLTTSFIRRCLMNSWKKSFQISAVTNIFKISFKRTIYFFSIYILATVWNWVTQSHSLHWFFLLDHYPILSCYCSYIFIAALRLFHLLFLQGVSL